MLSDLVVSVNEHCHNNTLEYLECLFRHRLQRSSIGAVGVRPCLSAQPRMPLEFENLNLLGFTEGSGQPLAAARLCF